MSDSFEKPSLVWNNELDTTPLKIRMSGHNLKIPRNYIALGGVASNGQVGLLLMASYPKFEGISESNFSTFSGLTEGKFKFMLRGATNITPNVIDTYRADRYYMPYRKKLLKLRALLGKNRVLKDLLVFLASTKGIT